MLSPSSVKQIPVRSSLQHQLFSRISQIWLPVDSKSTDPQTALKNLLGAGAHPLHFRPFLKIPWGLYPHCILKGLGAAPKELARRFVLLGAAEVTTLKYYVSD